MSEQAGKKAACEDLYGIPENATRAWFGPAPYSTVLHR